MLDKNQTVAPDKISTLIGPETRFQGKIMACGALWINGQVEGEILTTGDVIIGENARVIGRIQSRNTVIAGKVKGKLAPTGYVELAATAYLEGDIQVTDCPNSP